MGKKIDAAAVAVLVELMGPWWGESAITWVDDDNVIHIRNSERGTLDRCPQQWWWSWRESLRPKETPRALWFGSAVHEALAHYYKPGKKRASLKSTLAKFNGYADMEAEYIRTYVGDPDEAEWVDARTLGVSMLTEYVNHYGGDKHWDVIGTEQSFELRIPFMNKHNRDNPIVQAICKKYGDYFILNGTFDGVYRDERDGRVKLMEHKTAASISTAHLPMDNQAGSYWMVAESVGHAAGWLAPDEKISEITYNFLRKAMPDERPRDPQGYCTNKPIKVHYITALEKAGIDVNSKATLEVMSGLAERAGIVVLGDRSKTQPPPMFERHPVRKTNRQRATQLNRLQAEVVRMAMMVDGLMPVTKQPDRGTCPMCPFRDMCELHEQGSDWREYREALFRVEDLYAAHYRKSA